MKDPASRNSWRTPVICLGVALIYAVPLFTLRGAVDMFIKIGNVTGDVEGEATDPAHQNEIDVLAWSWGMSNSGTVHDGSDGSGGDVGVQDVTFTKYIDKASPDLMLQTLTGTTFDTATLYVTRDDGTGTGTRHDYIIITMEKVLITSVQSGGNDGEARNTENVTLNFAQVKVKYVEQSSGGTTGATHEFNWDVVNKVQLP